ncbi:glycosyltransferase family 4 protein [Methylocaldum szegediense]|uniref:Glycosyltransferase involved in cell wall biosynthesis n=1 Tax=Methylocaldum szegediense TaxID=73780 RepID=A0ABN8X2F6_9GAMM|nr:glycosyltransferase family 4 protein [Methylocaldum szegediense]CAI8832624.1 Glycosyltransferase involved in cell wall biosynthesis [Methylocaldum szegediense]
MTRPLGVWFPAIRAGSGTDVFTERLCAVLNARGLRAEITWLPLRAEYAPWTVAVPQPPAWATVVHVNSWLHQRFWPQKLPVLCTVHSCVHDAALLPFKRPLQRLYHRFWIHRIENAALQRAHRLVAVSHYTAHATIAASGGNVPEVIPNGVDTDFFQPTFRQAPHQPFRLLYVGNWGPRKGVDLLGPIMTALGTGFELLYTADRGGRHTRYALPENTRCLGRLDAHGLREAYAQADALLFSSRLEGLPLTVLEAMACGLPVIAARCSSLPEVVADGQTGLLCPVDDVAAFAAAARRLRSDVALWQALRTAARERAVALFDEARQVERYLDLYRQTSAKHNG